MTSHQNLADDRTLNDWLQFQLAAVRHATLREVSSLLVHDLSTPLHVIKFIRQRLETAATGEVRQEYIDRLASSVDSIIDTLATGRAYLQSGELRGVTESSLGEAWAFVGKLVRAKFFHKHIERLDLQIDHSASTLSIDLAICDLIFVLHQVVLRDLTPLLDGDSGKIPFQISSPGEFDKKGFIRFDLTTPLSTVNTKQLESLAKPPSQAEIQAPSNEWAGLRLALWIVRQANGSLSLVSSSHGQSIWRFEIPGHPINQQNPSPQS